MPSRSWKFRIDDIIEAIDKIGRYTNGIDFDGKGKIRNSKSPKFVPGYEKY